MGIGLSVFSSFSSQQRRCWRSHLARWKLRWWNRSATSSDTASRGRPPRSRWQNGIAIENFRPRAERVSRRSEVII